MKLNEKNNPGELLAGFILLAGALIMANSLTGCGLMGVRKADLWGAKFEFAEGIDFSFGANAIDRVDNRRGVSRSEEPPKSASRP